MTTDQVKDTITVLPSLSDEVLVHYMKCALSKQSAAEKKLYAPLLTAIEKERRKRGTSSTITKALTPKVSDTADAY